MSDSVICYHTTGAADAILREGFRDATRYIAGIELTGVWLGGQIMDANEGAKGDQVLQVVFNEDIDLNDFDDRFEIIEEGKPYREWCVPAALINEHATAALMTDDEVEAEMNRRFMDANPGFQPKPLPGWRD